MKNIEDMNFTEEQKEYIMKVIERRNEKTHQAIFARYGVKDLAELDDLFAKVAELNRKRSAHPFLQSKKCLKNIIGLNNVKKEISKIINMLEKQQLDDNKLCGTLCFVGDIGCGKSSVAEIFTKTLFEKSLIVCKEMAIENGNDLNCSELKGLFRNSNDVILINNASYLFRRSYNGEDYELYSQLDKYSGKKIVILSDTKENMTPVLKANKELSSRISSVIEFDKYTQEELMTLLLVSFSKKDYLIMEDAKEELFNVVKYVMKRHDFANLRTMKNMVEKILIVQADRTGGENDNRTIVLEDIIQYEVDEKISRTILSEAEKKYEQQLNEMVGLDSIKKQLLRIKAYALKNKDNCENLNLHMCFTGNPGTGKTEVAKLFAGLLYENGILPENKLIQKDRSTLIAKYLGQTAPLVREAVMEAMGGVLFIDEAYSLNSYDDEMDYGREAISELLTCMEEYRGQFAVIFAGYKDKTMDLIKCNPGLKSRINRFIDFPNYSKEELYQIAKLMINKSMFKCDDIVVEDVVQLVEMKQLYKQYANAREVRNILESLYEIQALRTQGTSDNTITEEDIKTYIEDNDIAFKLGEKIAVA